MLWTLGFALWALVIRVWYFALAFGLRAFRFYFLAFSLELGFFGAFGMFGNLAI